MSEEQAYDLLRIQQQMLDQQAMMNANMLSLAEMREKFETVAKSVYHLSDQVDLLHHTAYVGNNFLSFMAVCVALLAALAMFSVGFMVVKGR